VRQITTAAQLRAIVGEPIPRVAAKDLPALVAVHRRWLEASPFCLVATADDAGRCDVSPKGDPAGIAMVLDEARLAIPERPGNRRVDSYLNILQNPQVGLLFCIPGRSDTLRINGRAQIVADAEWFDQLTVRGHRPQLAMLVEVEQVFFHCAKAFLRSRLWQPETWTPEAVESRAQIAHQLERPDELIEDLERYYGPGYGENLYP
jgi:uncharacterized protein